MMSFLAQLLLANAQAKKEEDERPEHPVYRPFCPDCNDEGRDARHPCEGH